MKIVLACLTSFLVVISTWSFVSASTIQVDFNGVANSGPLASTPFSGSFTFNAGLMFPNTSIFDLTGPGFEITAVFSFGPYYFTQDNASVYNLEFDSSGQLYKWGFGGDVTGPNTTSQLIGPDFWVFTYVDPPPSNNVYGRYSPGGLTLHPSLNLLNWTARSTEVIPEPTTIFTMWISLLAMASVTRKRLRGLLND